VHIAGLQRLQRTATRVGAGNDDGLQRFTERSLNGRLPAFVDPDQVQIQGVVVGVMRKY
jgi:hypothetical protein